MPRQCSYALSSLEPFSILLSFTCSGCTVHCLGSLSPPSSAVARQIRRLISVKKTKQQQITPTVRYHSSTTIQTKLATSPRTEWTVWRLKSRIQSEKEKRILGFDWSGAQTHNSKLMRMLLHACWVVK